MEKTMRSDIIKSLRDTYGFLVSDYGYEIIDEEFSSNLFFYIRYENKLIERIISVGIDLRENEFSITIWKSDDGWTKDENMLEFEDFLKERGISEELKTTSGFPADLKVIEDINKNNARIFQEQGSGLVKGEEGF